MRLSHRMPDGSTQREHLQAVANVDDTPADLLVQPPEAGRVLWETYQNMGAGRPPSFGGFSLIPPSEMLAWQELHRLQLTSWEVDTLQAMDRACQAVAHELAERNKTSDKKQ